MVSVAAEVRAMRYRRPWYWLVALGIAAILATVFVLWNARSRVTLGDRQFEAAQMLRLQHMEQRIDAYFQEAEQMAALGAQTLGNVRGDRTLLRTLTLEIFRSHRDPALYGLGAFYEPYAFDPHLQWVSEYVHGGNRRFSSSARVLSGGVVEDFFVGTQPGTADNYRPQEWYKAAVAARGNIAYDGPYAIEGRSFISTVKAFYRDGRLAGVMSVDTLTPWFKAMMVSAVSSGDIAWIGGRSTGRWLLGTTALPKDTSSRSDRSVRLRYSGAVLHLSTDASPLYAIDRDIWAGAAVVIVAIWVLAAILARLLVQRWHSEKQTLELQLVQARLESEVAVGKTIAAELRKAAYTDALTGLPNRAAFIERATALLGDPTVAASHAILFVDLDRFNIINETLGHGAGDELLRLLAMRLAGVCADDKLARLGGDEFVIVVRGEEARDMAECALELIAQPLILAGRNVRPRASVGIVPIDATYAKADDLLRDADIAVHEAKLRGRGRIVVFDADMRRQAARESELETNLRRAIERKELVPYYQPIVSLTTGAIASFEALVRWNRPGRATMNAGEFMPFAESRALVHDIDSLVLPQVARHCATLFALFPDTSVAVNLSAAELSDRDLAERIEALLAQCEVAPSRLKLEITETTIMTPSDEVTANLDRLREIGVQLVLDDFGTGYSSLAYLQRLPVVGLKIDRTFVEHIGHDQRATELVRSIVALAHTFAL
ncbi:MAG TPA: EAL domain-containing protein, partial [Candidatus Baltobacteraceae bacterium]|nr:EAL domain-containing protein [Candidatus Baltobacteraceae bacterium]